MAASAAGSPPATPFRTGDRRPRRGNRSPGWPSSVKDTFRALNSLLNRGGTHGPSPRYRPGLAWGLWGTVLFSGGRRPAWSGLTFSSPSLEPLPRPAVACRVRSLARRSFLAARAVFRASDSWVSFMGTTRSRASSSRTSTSALVSSRSMVLDTFPLVYGSKLLNEVTTPQVGGLCQARVPRGVDQSLNAIEFRSRLSDLS